MVHIEYEMVAETAMVAEKIGQINLTIRSMVKVERELQALEAELNDLWFDVEEQFMIARNMKDYTGVYAIESGLEPSEFDAGRIAERAMDLYMSRALPIENGVVVPGESEYDESIKVMDEVMECDFVPEKGAGECLPSANKRKRSSSTKSSS